MNLARARLPPTPSSELEWQPECTLQGTRCLQPGLSQVFSLAPRGNGASSFRIFEVLLFFFITLKPSVE